MNFNGKMKIEMDFNLEKFNVPIIKHKNFSISNHKIFKKYSSELYQKYTFELLETLCNKSLFEQKTKILYKSIYFLLKFLYKSKNDIFIENYDLIILTSFYLGIKTVENQKKIPRLKKLKNVYQEKFGIYSNQEIKEAEIIYLKLLDYEINFMTVYDFLIYVFNKNKEYIFLHKDNLDIILKQNTNDFCIYTPLELIQKITNNSQLNRIKKYPIIVKNKIKYNSRENSFGDESLSTSISSGQHNNYIIYGNEHNNTNYNNKLEFENTLKNYNSRKLDISFRRPNKKHIFNYMNSSSNITIDNADNLDNEKMRESLIYNRKSVINLKNRTTKKETKVENNFIINKTIIKDKVFRNNNNSTYNINSSCSNNENILMNNSCSKNVYIKPYIKKQETQKYFTYTKKKEIQSKFISFKKLKKDNEDEDYKDNLKKKLFLEDCEYLE